MNIKSEIQKKSVFWNMVFSVLSALQSAFMLLVVTRIKGTETAGILSIAFATAYLMYTIGVYGMRNFQATDSERNYSYREYKRSRMFSCEIMIICSLLYCLLKGYSGFKAQVILEVCLLKLIEAIEDLYHGELQRIGRLDIAGQLGTVRLVIGYIAFVILLLVTDDLCISLGCVIILSWLLLIVTSKLICNFITEGCSSIRKEKVWNLFISCLPLFIASFFSNYISNAPKYAIDQYLSEKDQAYYAIISMPVFTINLLSNVVYRPQLLQMSKFWNRGDKDAFKKMICIQMRNIVGIALAILGVGIMIGLNVLEIIYGVTLRNFKSEFMILLLGGGMIAIYNFLAACITIIRKQACLIWIATFMVMFSSLISNSIVRYAGLTGASYLYFILMLVEMLIVITVLYFSLKKSD